MSTESDCRVIQRWECTSCWMTAADGAVRIPHPRKSDINGLGICHGPAVLVKYVPESALRERIAADLRAESKRAGDWYGGTTDSAINVVLNGPRR